MKKNKVHLFLFLIALGLFVRSYGQYTCSQVDGNIAPGSSQDEQALNTYWHYRYRLLHYFMIIGSKQGMGIPADRRNGGGGPQYPSEQMSNSDEGRSLGNYLAVLATEYRLLADNHQNTDETMLELYYALHAVFRNDSTFVANWSNYGSYDGSFFNSFPVAFPGYGILGLDEIGSINVLPTDNLNARLTDPSGGTSPYTYDNNFNPALPYSQPNNGEVGPITLDRGDGNGPDGTVTSKDNFIATLWGLAFVYKLVDDIQGYPGCCNPYGYNMSPKIMAQKLAIQIFNYMFNYSSLLLKTPDGKLAENSPTASADQHNNSSEYFTWPYDIPLRDMANDIFNYPGFITIPTVPFEINFLPDEGGSVTYALLLTDNGYFWNNYTVCNAASNFVKITGACDNTSIELGEYCASVSNDGGPYSTACDMINSFGTWDGNGCGCSGLTQSTANIGWEQYWGAANEILCGSQCSSVNFCALQQIIYSAPYHGPFCHIAAVNNFNNANTNYDYASCDWAGTKRFANPTNDGVYGNWGSVGNYNGMDYMLLYNMYYLLMEKQQTSIVIDDAHNSFVIYGTSGSDPSLTGFSGYNDSYPIGGGLYGEYLYSSDGSIVKSYEIGLSGDSYIQDITTGPGLAPYLQDCPFVINSFNCNPIIAYQLHVEANVSTGVGQDGPYPDVYTPLNNQNGGLLLQGSAESFIDLNPAEGPINVERGAYFDANCLRPCLPCTLPFTEYTFQSDPSVTNGQDEKPTKDSNSNKLPPYVPNSEFSQNPTENGLIAYPNPAKDQVTIDFEIKNTTPITIALYDMNGQKIADIINNATYNQGSYVAYFNGSQLASGTYTCVLITKDDKKAIKLVHTK